MEVPSVLRISVIPKQAQKNIYFKTMKAVYQILFVLCCYDFGFSEYKSNKQKLLWKSVTVIRSFLTCCVCILTIDNLGMIHNTIILAVYSSQYLLTVILLVLLNPNTTIRKFQDHLEVIDSKMRVDNASYNMEKRLFFGYLFNSAYRAIVCVCSCTIQSLCMTPVVSATVYTTLVMSLNIVYFSYIYVFHALNCRLKHLATILNSNTLDLPSMQHIYEAIVDLAELYKSTFDSVFIVALVYYIPETMISMYNIVEELIQEKSISAIFRYRSDYFIVPEALVILIAPAVFVGMLTTEANRIKIILHHKLMQERDDLKIYDIERFIHYVEARPCRFSVCKVIPMDADLIKMVLSFCVTYLIVIIQFTNN